MEIEYELTREDLFQFQLRAALHSPAAKRMRRNANLTVIGLFAIITLWSLTASWGTQYFWLNLGWWVFFFAIFIGTMKFFEVRITRRVLNKLLDEERPDAGRLGRHKLVLDDSGVTESTVVGESLTHWAGVHKLEQDETYIYIYTAPGAAHIVPKRAFQGEQQSSEFFEAARRWRGVSTT